MLDFARVRAKECTIQELSQGLTRDDLRRVTNEMIESELDLIAACTDADVVLVPEDPEADDSYAVVPDEAKIAWTLGHVIVHVTAFVGGDGVRRGRDGAGRATARGPFARRSAVAGRDHHRAMPPAA